MQILMSKHNSMLDCRRDICNINTTSQSRGRRESRRIEESHLRVTRSLMLINKSLWEFQVLRNRGVK